MTAAGKPRLGLRVAAVAAIVFGLASIASGGRVLFGSEAARRAAGNVVPFVLWFNFLSAFAYVAFGIGLLRNARFARPLAVALAAGCAVVLAAFGLHVATGGSFEPRTAVAMTIRTGFWVGLALFTRARLRPAETG